MTVVKFKSASFEAGEHESVLDCLLRNGQHIPYACKAGMCQACLVKAEAGTPPESANKWIKKPLQEKGYCLACQWVPDTDVAVSLPTVEEFSTEVRINRLSPLTPAAIRMKLTPTDPGERFISSPGQYLTLINPQGVSRSYSIANDYGNDGYLELHIAKTRHGVFTSWLFNEAKEGDICHIRGPAGECFYTEPETDRPVPLLLAGTGTGLAPLYGILNDALKKGHRGPIYLFHGARNPDALYYVAELQALSDQNPDFTYTPVCLENKDASPAGCQIGTVEEVIETSLNNMDLGSARVYLCGNPDFVHGMRRKVFLKGARSSNIFCDPFVERPISPD